MSLIIRNSFFYRLLDAIVGTLFRAWEFSFLGKVDRYLKESYDNSLVKKVWISFCSKDFTIKGTIYEKIVIGFHRLIIKIGSLLKKSLFYRLVVTVKDCYIKITKGSMFFRQINRLSIRQWLLVAFPLYLPIDYLFRTKISFGLLSSLWEELFIAAATFIILWRKMLDKSKAIDRETPLDIYIILFMSVGLLLMSIVNPHPFIALAGYRATVEYMIWFFLIIRLIEEKIDFKLVFYGFVAVGILLGLHGVYQYIIAVPIPASWVTQTEMGVRTRVFSITGSPNILGSLMVMIAPLAASMVYYCRKIISKLFYLAMTGAMCLCLLFTFSRGAWVGMVAAVILFALYMDKRLLGIMGMGLASALIFIPTITSRLTYLFTSDYAEASAIGGRTLRWETGRLLLMENNPWTGFGLGRFGGAVAMNNQILEETEEFSYFYMDNYYLKTMVEMGYIGIAFFLLLIMGLMIWGLRAVYRSGTEFLPKQDPLFRAVGNEKAMAVGIISGLSGVLVHCYFENIFEEPYMMAYFWGLAAVLMYLGLRTKPSIHQGDNN